MAWIKIISLEEATGKLKTLYNKIKGPNDNIDNVMLVHGIRPHSLEAHMTIYKKILHSKENTLPKWIIESLGLYVSIINGCNYCIEHHYQGLRRLVEDDIKSKKIRDAFEQGNISDIFHEKELILMEYAAALTETPSALMEYDIDELRKIGWTDGEVLEANQVVSYFAYANRTVLGLGVNTEGDVLGTSPNSEEEDNWQHQ